MFYAYFISLPPPSFQKGPLCPTAGNAVTETGRVNSRPRKDRVVRLRVPELRVPHVPLLLVGVMSGVCCPGTGIESKIRFRFPPALCGQE